MSNVLNVVLVGGVLVLGYMMITSYQASGNPFSFVPTGPVYAQVQVQPSSTIEEEYSNIQCLSDDSKCRWCSTGIASSSRCRQEFFCGPWVTRGSKSDSDVMDDARDEFVDVANENADKCKGKTVTTKPIASKTISPITNTSKPTATVPVIGKGCPVTGTSCSLKYKSLCHVEYRSDGSCFCRCPALSGQAGFRQTKHATVFAHSHDRLNIPRAFIGKKRRPAKDVRLHAF